MKFAGRARLVASKRLSIVFRASRSIAVNSATASITIPSTVKNGDAMVLVVGWSISSGQTLTPPSGWIALGGQINDESQVASMAFKRIAVSGDQASSVSLPLSAIGNLTALLACYGNTDDTDPVDAYLSAVEGGASSTTHTAPSVVLTGQYDWLVTAVVDKANPHTTVWTPPAGITMRASGYNTSQPAVTGAIGDSAGEVPSGATGTQVWTGDGSTSRAVSWTIGIKRGTRINGGKTNIYNGSLYVGAASWDWDGLLVKSGDMTIARSYDAGFDTNLPSHVTGAVNPKPVSFFLDRNMTVVHSFKPDLALLAANDTATVAGLHSLLQSALGKKVWWCVNHEPENDTVGTNNSLNNFTLADYVTAWQNFADIVHSYNEPGWQTVWIMMSYTWKTSFATLNPGFTPDSWYPGDQYVDIVGIDDYNEGSLHNNPGDGTPQRWDSPGYGWGDPHPDESLSPNGSGYYDPILLNWLVQHGKNYAICEFGSIRNMGAAMGRAKTDAAGGPYTLDWWTGLDVSNSKADWIRAFSKYHMITVPSNFDTQCVALMYFDTNGRTWTDGTTTESWRLHHTPGDVDYTAYGDVFTAYNTATND